MAFRSYDFSIGESKIDVATSTIRQVSLISLGQAKGHETEEGKQIWVDGKSLDQIFDCLTEMGSLKLKVDHGSGVMSTAGWIDAFSKTGSKILGDMHVYEAEPERPRMFEIAQKNPDHLGLSLEFSGDDEEIGNKAFARCDEVFAVALVSEPAANSSLFEKSTKNVDLKFASSKNSRMATRKSFDDAPEAAADPIAEMGKKFDAFCQKYDADKADRDEKMKRFDDYLNNADGRPAPSGPDRNIDPNVTPVVTDDQKSAESDKQFEDKDEDKKDDDKKDDKVNTKDLSALVEREVEKRVKAFAASLGTKIPTAGTGPGITNGRGAKKDFGTLYRERTKELKGDKNRAMLECLKEYKEEYAEYRKTFMKVEPKGNVRTL